MTPQLLDMVLKARADELPICLIASADGGTLSAIDPATDTQWPAMVLETARKALQSGRVETCDTDDGQRYLLPQNPPAKAIIIGAVHITQALIPILNLADISVTVIDPRSAFLNDARFSFRRDTPGVTVDTRWPDEALDEIKISSRTAIITLTHDPKLDDPGLDAALKSPAFYIGALGSKRTHAKRVERLTQAGFTPLQIERIAAPVGLDIGAKSPAEIAVSIAAQIITRLRKG